MYPDRDRELEEVPFCLKDKTLIYPQRTELLFDLQTETDNDDDKQDSRYQGSLNSVGSFRQLFIFFAMGKVHYGASTQSVSFVLFLIGSSG